MMPKTKNSVGTCAIEMMEPRVLFSFSYEAELFGDAAKGGGGGKGGKPAPAAPEIRLDLVALHEFGHSLGLGHTSDTKSIMYAYYNPNYDVSNFEAGNDWGVTEVLRLLNETGDATGWHEHEEGELDLTYSFMVDGAEIGQERGKAQKNTLNAALAQRFGSAAAGQQIIVEAIERWSTGTDGAVAFTRVSENQQYAFNAFGADQGDPRFGDIRIGGHKFDGPSKTLAHTYYPPPNGYTASGDAHFDVEEAWTTSSTSSGALGTTFVQQTSSYAGAFATGRLIASHNFFTVDADDDHWLS